MKLLSFFMEKSLNVCQAKQRNNIPLSNFVSPSPFVDKFLLSSIFVITKTNGLEKTLYTEIRQVTVLWKRKRKWKMFWMKSYFIKVPDSCPFTKKTKKSFSNLHSEKKALGTKFILCTFQLCLMDSSSLFASFGLVLICSSLIEIYL